MFVLWVLRARLCGTSFVLFHLCQQPSLDLQLLNQLQVIVTTYQSSTEVFGLFDRIYQAAPLFSLYQCAKTGRIIMGIFHLLIWTLVQRFVHFRNPIYHLLMLQQLNQ